MEGAIDARRRVRGKCAPLAGGHRPLRFGRERLPQRYHGSTGHHVIARAARSCRSGRVVGIALEQPLGAAGKLEANGILRRVHENDEAVPHHPRPPFVEHGEGVTAHREGERRDPRTLPIAGAHFLAVGAQPDQILRGRVPHEVAGEEPMSLQNGQLLSERGQASRELEERLLAIVEAPFEPRNLVVLAIGVVVARLRAPHLVAGEEHGDSCEKKSDERRFLWSFAQGDDALIVGSLLRAVIPGMVVVGAVAVVLSVGLVVGFERQ